MQPEVMVVEPASAHPGEVVSLSFMAPKDRGVLYAIEQEADGGWQRLHLMISDANGDEPRWFPAGEEPIVPAVGVVGPGPDRVPIPDVLAPGEYRICTANAVQNICTPIEIVAAWDEPAAYAFTMDAGCGFRLLHGRFRVEVRDGEVVDFVDLDPGTGNPTLDNASIPTLRDLLDRVAEAQERPGSVVTFETDPRDGHPITVSIDWIVSAVDDEECYEITDYAQGAS